MNDDQLIQMGYYGRKDGRDPKYNFELKPLIDGFSFYDFVIEGMKSKDENQSHGAILLITNKQYILGYTEGFGVGAHNVAYARAMTDMNGGGNLTFHETVKSEKPRKQNYLCAKITLEYLYNVGPTPVFSGGIQFSLPNGHTITPEQYEVFEQFYNDYNAEIKSVINRIGSRNFAVSFQPSDKGTEWKTCDSLDELRAMLSTCIDTEKAIPEESVIVGKGVEPLQKQNI